jgi:hypothetical protein
MGCICCFLGVKNSITIVQSAIYIYTTLGYSRVLNSVLVNSYTDYIVRNFALTELNFQ